MESEPFVKDFSRRVLAAWHLPQILHFRSPPATGRPLCRPVRVFLPPAWLLLASSRGFLHALWRDFLIPIRFRAFFLSATPPSAAILDAGEFSPFAAAASTGAPGMASPARIPTGRMSNSWPGFARRGRI